MNLTDDRYQAPNLKAWTVQAGDFPREGTIEDQMRFLLQYALLAANSHNTQPWLFQVRDNTVALYWDSSRALVLSDPSKRQGMISLGCALGTLVIAGEYFGFAPRVTFGQQDDGDLPIAIVQMNERESHEPGRSVLFHSLVERRMNRFPYTRRPLGEDTLASLHELCDVEDVTLTFVTDDLQRECMLATIYHSTLGTQGDVQIVREWSGWMRPRDTPNFDGIPLTDDFGFPGPLSLIAPFVWRVTPGTTQAKNTRKLFSTSPAFFVISGPDTREHWLRTGQVLTNLGLAATRAGIAYAPWGAVVEHEPSAELVRSVLHLPGRVLFFGRLGYAKKVPSLHTPRRPLQEVLREYERCVPVLSLAEQESVGQCNQSV